MCFLKKARPPFFSKCEIGSIPTWALMVLQQIKNAYVCGIQGYQLTKFALIELFSLLIMEKLTLFSLNATHDGCRVVDARFLASFGSMTPRSFLKIGKNTTFF